MFLYSISAGAGLISFTLMLLISFLTTEMVIYIYPLLLFLTLKDLVQFILLESRTRATLYEATKAGFDNLAH